MTFEERKALEKSYLGKKVDIKIDRPIGYVHKKENYSLTYPLIMDIYPVFWVVTVKNLMFTCLV